MARALSEYFAPYISDSGMERESGLRCSLVLPLVALLTLLYYERLTSFGKLAVGSFSTKRNSATATAVQRATLAGNQQQKGSSPTYSSSVACSLDWLPAVPAVCWHLCCIKLFGRPAAVVAAATVGAAALLLRLLFAALCRQ